MLLHANRLNADLLDKILKIFEQKHYKFVDLSTAQSDAAYQDAGYFGFEVWLDVGLPLGERAWRESGRQPGNRTARLDREVRAVSGAEAKSSISPGCFIVVFAVPLDSL